MQTANPWLPESFPGTLAGVVVAYGVLAAQPAAVAVLAWGAAFAVRRKTRAYGLHVLRWATAGWVTCFALFTTYLAVRSAYGGHAARDALAPGTLALSVLVSSAGFAVGGFIAAGWRKAIRLDIPPTTEQSSSRE
jgi:hypothetical protein